MKKRREEEEKKNEVERFGRSNPTSQKSHSKEAKKRDNAHQQERGWGKEQERHKEDEGEEGEGEEMREKREEKTKNSRQKKAALLPVGPEGHLTKSSKDPPG